MPLGAGSHLGCYDILSPLGAGGMGEVSSRSRYHAQPQVAIKILPEVFARNPERLARFSRKAQASLNHAYIAPIHGLEESGDVRAFVMELERAEDPDWAALPSEVPAAVHAPFQSCPAAPDHVIVILNWGEELRRLVPTN